MGGRTAVITAAACATIFLLALVVWLLWNRSSSNFALDARRLTSYTGSQASPAFSPDGKTIAFSWGGPRDGDPHIWTQPVNGGSPTEITHGNDSRPSWSPDGRQIAFVRVLDKLHNEIDTIDPSGRHEQKRATVFSTAPAPGRVEWSPDGKYLLTSDRDSPDAACALVLISIASGEKRRLTAPEAHSIGDTDAVFSPDARWIAFRHTAGPSVEDLYVLPAPSLSSREPAPAGEYLRLTSDGRPIGGHAWTPDSSSIILSSRRGDGTYGLWLVPLSAGKPRRLTQAGVVAVHPAISPHGDFLAYESVINDSNIWALDLAGKNAPRRVVASTLLDASPQFSPDGKRIAFRSARTGSSEIWVADADGGHAREVTFFKAPLADNPRWSPDGRLLAFDCQRAGNPDIYIVPADGGAPRQITTEPASDVAPSWSRDGKFVYFASDRSGQWQVWKQPVAAGPAQQVTTNGGFAAFESFDGRYVYYSKNSSEGGLWRMPVAGGQETAVIPDLAAGLWGNWALSRRGVYYLKYRAEPPTLASILFLDFATNATSEIGSTSGSPMAWDSGLALSPDERTLLYAQIDGRGSNIYVADHFR